MLAGGCKRALPSTTSELVKAASTKFANTRTLLNRVTGEARDGEILAVLGASGSGKSTFIDALANRIAKESLQGTVKLNGEAVGQRLMRSISAYVSAQSFCLRSPMEIDLSPKQSQKLYEGDGGSYYTWSSSDLPMLAEAKVGGAKLHLQPHGLALPSYSDSAKIVYVLHGPISIFYIYIFTL